MNIDLKQHARELDQLEGISLRFVPSFSEDGYMSVSTAMKFKLKEEAPLRITPAEEDELHPTLVNWNRKALQWLPKLEKFESWLVWGLGLGLGLWFMEGFCELAAWTFGKLLKAW